MRIHLAFVIVACLAASASADTRRRVVVVDFEGPRELADAARPGVLAALAGHHDLVSEFWWRAARMASPGRDTTSWWKVASAANVDAVIEGWIDRSRWSGALILVVRDARNGTIIDTVSAAIADSGVVEHVDELAPALDEILAWVEGPF
jgi:hypothetical protein